MLSLFAFHVKLRFKSMLAFRGSFLIFAIAQVMSYSANLFVVWIMMSKFQTLHGWDWPEVALLYSLNLFTYALGASFFFTPMTQLEQLIVNGSLDQFLTKPRDPLYLLVSNKYTLAYIAHISLATVVLLWALGNLNIVWTAGKVLYFVLVLIGGALIQSAGLILVGCWAFVFTRSQAFSSIYQKLRDYINYPISLYGLFTQILLTTLLPLAFINFFPAAVLLEKDREELWAPGMAHWALPVGFVAFALMLLLWRRCIRLYQGSGG